MEWRFKLRILIRDVGEWTTEIKEEPVELKTVKTEHQILQNHTQSTTNSDYKTRTNWFIKLIKKIIKLFRINPPIVEHISAEDEKLDQEIKVMKEGLIEFNKIVGENPMDEIDYIIANGFKTYNELYRSAVDGSLLRKKSADAIHKFNLLVQEKKLANTDNRETDSDTVVYVRGGLGNGRLIGISHYTQKEND